MQEKFQLLSRIAGTGAALTGGLSLVGWALNISALTQVIPGSMPMVFNAAMGFVVAGLLLLYLGFRFGRWIGTINSHKLIEDKEKELFTAQKGFKALYEEEIAKLKQANAELKERAPNATVVQKPIDREELRAAVAEVFSKTPQGGRTAAD